MVIGWGTGSTLRRLLQCSLLGRAPYLQPLQAGRKILLQVRPGAHQRFAARDQNVVVVGHAVSGQDFPREFAQPALRPVAGDGVADLLAGREAHEQRRLAGIGMLAVVVAAGLQDQAGSYPFTACTGYSQKFWPPLEGPDARRTRFRRHRALRAQTPWAPGPAGGEKPAPPPREPTGGE